MKLVKLLAIALSFATIATSCGKDIETPTAEGKKISVSAQMYNFTRATDTSFEEGDKIGLHIITPTATWLDNALYTYSAGTLVGAQTNLWYTEESVTSDVFAYYPYNEAAAYNEAGYTFTVNADQSTAAAYTASDLMVAATTSAPTEAAVQLPFRHVLSKVVVTIDNQLGEEIANVWFSDVYGTTTVNLADGTSEASGSKGTIKAASVNANGVAAWALIVVPQSEATPDLMVTTTSGKQYTFAIAEPVTFSAGKVSTAEIALTRESIATDFTPTISDWEADNDLQFNQTTEGEEEDKEEDVVDTATLYLAPGPWTVDGAWFAAYFFGEGNIYTWATLTDEDTDGIYECIVPEGYDNVIFCRMNPAETTPSWEAKWNQTNDLTIGENNLYTVTGWGDGTDICPGTWSVK